jgi:Uma2 family endonuclease
MVIRDKLYTADEFWEIARLPENAGRRLELDEGVIVEKAPSSPINTIIASRMIYHLSAFVIPRNLGYVTAPDGGFKLAPRTTRQPDAAFVSKTRVPVIPHEFEIAPDLAVEIVSPNEDIFKKVGEYLRAGTRIVWGIYADEKTVYVFHLDADGKLAADPKGIDDMLDGEDVLPGFQLAVKDIFPE